MTDQIQARLMAEQDLGYRDFQAKLMPGIDPERIIGVRTPILRKMAKELAKLPDIDVYLADLPHRYYDENNLHGFIISACRDYEKAVAYVDALLPHVDNWATCDLLSPRVFAKNRSRLGSDIDRWLASDATYTIRFGIEMVMSHFLDEAFDPIWLQKVASIRSNEYYVNMMLAWFFATALAKQWDSTIGLLTGNALDRWVHNKTIQKAVESYRITPEQKDFLRSLRRPR